MHMCITCVLGACPWRSEEGTGSHGAGVLDSCGPLSGCWESNPGPLQQQQVLLTTEPYDEGETKSEFAKVLRLVGADSR